MTFPQREHDAGPMPPGFSEPLFVLLTKPTRGKSPKGHPQGSPLDCWDLSPLFSAKLAEPIFWRLTTFLLHRINENLRRILEKAVDCSASFALGKR